MFLEFPSTKDGYGDIIQLGDGSTAQSQLSQVPYEIVLDRVYVHGAPALRAEARHRAERAAGDDPQLLHRDIKAVGADAQAIGGWNGPGPFSIENNYLEASGEVFLLGGADPGDSQSRERGRVGPLQPHVAADGVARSDHPDAGRRDRHARRRGRLAPGRDLRVSRRRAPSGWVRCRSATSVPFARDHRRLARRRGDESRGTPSPTRPSTRSTAGRPAARRSTGR